MKVFLVRHGRSVANEDKRLHATMADHEVPLAEMGYKQARDAGHAIKDFIQQASEYPTMKWRGDEYIPSYSKVTMVVSPYVRTRQTADEIQFILGDRIEKRLEDVNLVEHQFGLFNGMADPDTVGLLRQEYPKEFAFYDLQVERQGKFWARMPLGESHFDVARRAGDAIRTIQSRNDEVTIVVSHAYTISAFVMQWCGLPYEWTYKPEAKSANCEVRLLTYPNIKEPRCIHAGYKKPTK